MATRQTANPRPSGDGTVAPWLLFLWMIVPLGMTIWFSLLRY